MYILIEITIFISAAFFLFCQFVNRGMYRIPFFVGAVFVIGAECVNEFVFAGQGTFYPDSLIYFPFTRFTLGIVVLGALYAVTAHYVTKLICRKPGFRNTLAKYPVFLGLLLVSIPFELFGLSTGYWELPKGLPQGNHIYFYLTSVYIFYLGFTLPVFVLSEKMER